MSDSEIAGEENARLEAALEALKKLQRKKTVYGYEWGKICRVVIISVASLAAFSLLEMFVLNRRASLGFSAWLFLRLYGLVYLNAYVSFHIQLKGLIGERGVLPASLTMDSASRSVAPPATSNAAMSRSARLRLAFWTRFRRLSSYTDFPSLCWFVGTSNRALLAQSWIGIAASVLLLLDVGPPMLWGLVCYVCYLSLRSLSGPFMGLQWDALILEAGLLAVALSPLQLRVFSAVGTEVMPDWPSRAVRVLCV